MVGEKVCQLSDGRDGDAILHIFMGMPAGYYTCTQNKIKYTYCKSQPVSQCFRSDNELKPNRNCNLELDLILHPSSPDYY